MNAKENTYVKEMIDLGAIICKKNMELYKNEIIWKNPAIKKHITKLLLEQILLKFEY